MDSLVLGMKSLNYSQMSFMMDGEEENRDALKNGFRKSLAIKQKK